MSTYYGRPFEVSSGLEPIFTKEYDKMNAATSATMSVTTEIIDAIHEPSTASQETLAQLKAKLESLPPGMRKKLESFFNIQANKAAQNANKKEKRRVRNKIASESRKKNR